jgi:outer membrane protein assembly factor BamB
VYVAPRYGSLYGFNARTGTKVWDSGAVSNLYYSSPGVANGVVYAGNLDGWMYAFDASDGTALWSAMAGDDVDSSPAIVNGMVYVSSLDGRLHAYDLTAGPGAPARPDPKDLHPNLALRPQE